jgi:hypothetical protein
MQQSVAVGDEVLLAHRELNAIKQLKTDHPLTVRATKPTVYPKI